MLPSQLKLGVIITATEVYPAIPLLVTFDLYLGHRVSISSKYAVSVYQDLGMSARWNLVWL